VTGVIVSAVPTLGSALKSSSGGRTSRGPPPSGVTLGLGLHTSTAASGVSQPSSATRGDFGTVAASATSHHHSSYGTSGSGVAAFFPPRNSGTQSGTLPFGRGGRMGHPTGGSGIGGNGAFRERRGGGIGIRGGGRGGRGRRGGRGGAIPIPGSHLHGHGGPGHHSFHHITDVEINHSEQVPPATITTRQQRAQSLDTHNMSQRPYHHHGHHSHHHAAHHNAYHNNSSSSAAANRATAAWHASQTVGGTASGTMAALSTLPSNIGGSSALSVTTSGATPSTPSSSASSMASPSSQQQHTPTRGNMPSSRVPLGTSPGRGALPMGFTGPPVDLSVHVSDGSAAGSPPVTPSRIGGVGGGGGGGGGSGPGSPAGGPRPKLSYRSSPHSQSLISSTSSSLATSSSNNSMSGRGSAPTSPVTTAGLHVNTSSSSTPGQHRRVNSSPLSPGGTDRERRGISGGATTTTATSAVSPQGSQVPPQMQTQTPEQGRLRPDMRRRSRSSADQLGRPHLSTPSSSTSSTTGGTGGSNRYGNNGSTTGQITPSSASGSLASLTLTRSSSNSSGGDGSPMSGRSMSLGGNNNNTNMTNVTGIAPSSVQSPMSLPKASASPPSKASPQTPSTVPSPVPMGVVSTSSTMISPPTGGMENPAQQQQPMLSPIIEYRGIPSVPGQSGGMLQLSAMTTSIPQSGSLSSLGNGGKKSSNNSGGTSSGPNSRRGSRTGSMADPQVQPRRKHSTSSIGSSNETSPGVSRQNSGDYHSSNSSISNSGGVGNGGTTTPNDVNTASWDPFFSDESLSPQHVSPTESPPLLYQASHVPVAASGAIGHDGTQAITAGHHQHHLSHQHQLQLQQQQQQAAAAYHHQTNTSMGGHITGAAAAAIQYQAAAAAAAQAQLSGGGVAGRGRARRAGSSSGRDHRSPYYHTSGPGTPVEAWSTPTNNANSDPLTQPSHVRTSSGNSNSHYHHRRGSGFASNGGDDDHDYTPSSSSDSVMNSYDSTSGSSSGMSSLVRSRAGSSEHALARSGSSGHIPFPNKHSSQNIGGNVAMIGAPATMMSPHITTGGYDYFDPAAAATTTAYGDFSPAAIAHSAAVAAAQQQQQQGSIGGAYGYAPYASQHMMGRGNGSNNNNNSNSSNNSGRGGSGGSGHHRRPHSGGASVGIPQSSSSGYIATGSPQTAASMVPSAGYYAMSATAASAAVAGTAPPPTTYYTNTGHVSMMTPSGPVSAHYLQHLGGAPNTGQQMTAYPQSSIPTASSSLSSMMVTRQPPSIPTGSSIGGGRRAG
jgi:hypothetical protein